MASLNILLITLQLVTTTLALSKCYFPNGLPSPRDVPCNPNAANSPCCAPSALCTDTGLCLDPPFGWSRGSCTDPDWGDDCTSYCRNVNPNGGIPVLVCNSDGGLTYQCGSPPGNNTCDGETFSLSSAKVQLREDQLSDLVIDSNKTLSDACKNISSEAATTTAHAGAAATSSPSTAANNSLEPMCHSGYSSGAMAGLGVGLGVPLLLAILGSLYLLRRERKTTNLLKNQTPPRPFQEKGNWDTVTQPPQGEYVSELGTDGRPEELPTGRKFAELPEYRRG